MVIGILELRGFFITLQAGSRANAALMGFFPPFTYIMSTYDGTLGALLIVTVLLPLYSFFTFGRR
jgi:hypothetical protein